MNKERENGLDIIKALATFFVVAVHFYLSCGYYQTPIISLKMYVMTFVRWGGMVAVPLFLMATGYFKAGKKPDKKHYMALIPILITYVVLCSIRMVVENIAYGQIHTIESGIKSLLTYQAAWYVGMYIGLMLLCPFLNIMWHACGAKEQRILLVSLAAITFMYPLTGYVFPSYFQYIYPITYYLLGVYIKEQRPKFNKLLLCAMYFVMTFINGAITIVSSASGPYAPGILASVDNGQNAITIAVAAVCLFLLFYDVKINNSVAVTLVKSMSDCSLEIYLLQAAYNAIIYTYTGRFISGAENYFWVFFITVPLSFVLSWISAALYKAVYKRVQMIIRCLYAK